MRLNIVVVEAENGREHKLQVDPTDHVSRVKEWMQFRSGIPARRQSLYFENTKLKDTMELAFLGMDNARITLAINSEQRRINVLVKTMTSEIVVIQNPSIPQIPESSKSEIVVEVEEMDTVRVLKHKIYQRTVVPQGKHIVLHYQGVELILHRRLCGYGVGMDSEIIATLRTTEKVQGASMEESPGTSS